MEPPAVQLLRNRFAAFVTKPGGPLRTLVKTTEMFRSRGWTVFAFGGTPRGVYDNGNQYTPRDVDLVFRDEHFPLFESAFEQSIVRRNSYGGLRLKIDDLTLDAWPLSGTWAFREGHVGNPSFEVLPSTTFLNVDGIVIELVPERGKKRRVYESGFFSGWLSKTLDINLTKNPHPAICVARTLHIARHFRFQFASRLTVYMREMLNNLTLTAVEGAQLKHYGRVEFDGPMLLKIRRSLEAHVSKNALLPLALFPAPQMELGDFARRSSPGASTCVCSEEREASDPDAAFMDRLIDDTLHLRSRVPRSEDSGTGKER